MPRNRLRNELLPLLRQHYQPSLTRTVSRVIEIVRGESDLVGDLAAQWLQGRTAFQPVRRTPPRERSDNQPSFSAITLFDDLPLAVQRRVILLQLQELGLPLDFDWVEQLRTVPESPLNVGLDLFATRHAGGWVTLSAQSKTVEFKAEEQRLDIAMGKGEASFAGVTVAWETLGLEALKRPLSAEPGRELFDAARVGPLVVLRHWRPGDRFQPLGMKTAVKLQDLFTNAKIPREQRRKMLVASAQGEIFWVEGLRMAEQFKLTKSTKGALLWRWKRVEEASGSEA
jgi:tRNA(Ile)-lysidine synthase